ncbi:MAG: hypothetical protein GX458_21920, partial [Phyllobacteriaceae bacterium]|nr:hypothetical protein [Phyllobacteriaceae bacterium]
MVTESPLTVGPPTAVSASGLDTATLTAGRIVEARITALAGQMAVLASRQGPLEIDLGTRAAAVGDLLRFEVKAVDGGDGQTRLMLELMPQSASAEAPPPVTASAELARQALGQAVAKAAVGQSGLSPLFAALSGLAAAPPANVPEPVAALIGRLLDGRLAAGAAPTAASVATAFRNSGLFLEAKTALPSATPAAGEDLKGLLGRLREALTAWVGPPPGNDRSGATAAGRSAVPGTPAAAAASGRGTSEGTVVPERAASMRPGEATPSVGGLAVRAAYGAGTAVRPTPTVETRSDAPARLAAQAYGAAPAGRAAVIPSLAST